MLKFGLLWSLGIDFGLWLVVRVRLEIGVRVVDRVGLVLVFLLVFGFMVKSDCSCKQK